MISRMGYLSWAFLHSHTATPGEWKNQVRVASRLLERVGSQLLAFSFYKDRPQLKKSNPVWCCWFIHCHSVHWGQYDVHSNVYQKRLRFIRLVANHQSP
jgi:hypothetical protein